MYHTDILRWSSNWAKHARGACFVFLKDKCLVTLIVDHVFKQRKISHTHTHTICTHFSVSSFRGKVLMVNNTFQVATARGEIPIFAYRTDRDNTFLLTEDVRTINLS